MPSVQKRYVKEAFTVFIASWLIEGNIMATNPPSYLTNPSPIPWYGEKTVQWYQFGIKPKPLVRYACYKKIFHHLQCPHEHYHYPYHLSKRLSTFLLDHNTYIYASTSTTYCASHKSWMIPTKDRIVGWNQK